MTDRIGSAPHALGDAAADPIRVLVVDDHQLFRRGLQLVLAREEGITVVGEAGDGAQGLAMASRLTPDVMLMDVRMPGGTGIQACAQIKRNLPATSIVIVTMSDTDADLLDAMRAGAAGYLFKESSSSTIAATVRSVAAGRSTVGRTMAARLLAEFDDIPAGQAVQELDPRERGVMQLLAAGREPADAGRDLGLSAERVGEVVRAVLDKVAAHSLTASVGP